MPVHFLTSELSRWDQAEGDALVLTFFADERPLRGAAGLADWRLCGKLSRLIKHRRIHGDDDEVLMLPPGRRLPFPRILLFGLGGRRGFGEDDYREQVRRVRDVMARAQLAKYAIQPPGRATGLIAARRALELWIEVEESDRHDTQVAIIDTPGAQKEMADILRIQKRFG